MSSILLLHSALGLRPAVLDLAEHLRASGHEVTAPDYYDGHVFDTEEAGVDYRDQIGSRALLTPVLEIADDLPADTVLMGLSLGAAFAQRLALSRPSARAVVLLHHVSPPPAVWPGQPVQVHRYARDHWIDEGDLDALAEVVRASGAELEDVVVPGEGHLFTDPGMPDHDPEGYTRSLARIDAFLN